MNSNLVEKFISTYMASNSFWKIINISTLLIFLFILTFSIAFTFLLINKYETNVKITLAKRQRDYLMSTIKDLSDVKSVEIDLNHNISKIQGELLNEICIYKDINNISITELVNKNYKNKISIFIPILIALLVISLGITLMVFLNI